MKNKLIEIATLCVLACVGALCMMDTPEPVISFQKDYLGNSGYPRIVGTLLIISSLLYSLFILRDKNPRKGEGITSASFVLPLTLACLYIAGIVNVGFATSSVIFIFCFSLIGQGAITRKLVTSGLIVSVAVTAVTYGAFRIFKVYLPDTVLF